MFAHVRAHTHTTSYTHSPSSDHIVTGVGERVKVQTKEVCRRGPDVTPKMQIGEHNDKIKAVYISTQDQDYFSPPPLL